MAQAADARRNDPLRRRPGLLSRIPLAPPSFWGFTIQLLAGPAPVSAAVHLGPAHQGKVHPATWTGYAVALATAVIPLALIYTNSWAGIAAKLPGVGG